MFSTFVSGFLTACDLLNAEDHELRRLGDGHADFGNDLARLANRRRIGLVVALHEEGLLGGCPEQPAVPPLIRQKVADRPDDALPQRGIIGFKNYKLGALVDRFAKKVEKTARADIAEVAVEVAAQGPCSEDLDVAVKIADDIDAVRIEQSLLGLGEPVIDPHRTLDILVGRRFEDTASGIDTSVNPGHVSAGWDREELTANRIEYL